MSARFHMAVALLLGLAIFMVTAPAQAQSATATVLSSSSIRTEHPGVFIWSDDWSIPRWFLYRQQACSGDGELITTKLWGEEGTFTDQGLSPATSYSYRWALVWSLDENGQPLGEVSSYYSNCVTTLANAPAAPTGLGATTTSGTQANLTWTDASSNETGFKIERKTGAGGTYAQIATVGAGVTTYSNTGLSAGTTYFYRVRATNSGGDSAFSNEATATPLASLYFVQVDHLNTPRLVADTTGTTVWRWDQQEPFGADTPNGDPGNTGTTFDFPLRLPGQYFDRETNLAYNSSRDYDAVLGRYVQSDSIGLQGGLNTYLYVNARPVALIDIFGLAAACGKKKSCQDMIKPIRDLLESAYPQTYKGIKCTIKCDKLWRGRGKTSGSVITLNTDDYGEVEPNSNLINYIQTMAHELRHCKGSPWDWSNFGSSDPDSIFANPSHVQLDQEAEKDAWGVVQQAQRLF